MSRLQDIEGSTLWLSLDLKRSPGDVKQIYASTGLANRELSWKSKQGLDEMTACMATGAAAEKKGNARTSRTMTKTER